MDAREYFRRLLERQLVLVADEASALPSLRDWGEAELLDQVALYTTADRPALVVPSKLETVGLLYDRWEDPLSPLAHLSIARYDASAAAARYAMEVVLGLGLDASAAVERRAERYQALLSCDDVEVLSGASELLIRCAEELEIANMDGDVRPRWLQSVTEFLEASVVNIEDVTSSFSVAGTLEFDGLSYLFNTPEVRDAYGPPMRELMLAAARGGENHAEFVDNRLDRLIVDGEDVSAFFHWLYSGKERDAAVTEFGFGCARFTPDWTVNSPLHKCSEGVFVGVGMGHLLPHVDLISTRARPRFVERSPA